MIQLFNGQQWQQMKLCPTGINEDTARDMLEHARSKIVKKELRLVKVIPPTYIPPEIVVLDA